MRRRISASLACAAEVIRAGFLCKPISMHIDVAYLICDQAPAPYGDR
jgi:hypothetical protein